jgi:hypothetical protein
VVIWYLINQKNKAVYFYSEGGAAWFEPNQPGYSGAGWTDAATEEETELPRIING